MFAPPSLLSHLKNIHNFYFLEYLKNKTNIQWSTKVTSDICWCFLYSQWAAGGRSCPQTAVATEHQLFAPPGLLVKLVSSKSTVIAVTGRKETSPPMMDINPVSNLVWLACSGLAWRIVCFHSVTTRAYNFVQRGVGYSMKRWIMNTILVCTLRILRNDAWDFTIKQKWRKVTN